MLNHLRVQANRRPNHPAVVGTGVEWTWQELAARVDTLAAKLVEEDVQPGDVIGVCMSRCPEIIETYLAIAKVGAIAAPVNYKLEAHHLSDLVEVCGMTRVIAEPRFEGLLDLSKPPAKPSTAPGACYLNYTSGSTGRPKGAVTTQAQILANAQATVDGLGFSEDDVFLCMFSAFAHPHEIFHRALLTGATMVVIDTMSPRVVAEAIQSHRITWMMAVPSFYEMMLDHIGPGRFDMSSLRMMEAGGAWCPPERLERLEERFNATFLPVWGSTETTGVVLALNRGPRPGGATGRVVAPYEVSVRDHHGREVADDTPGEMWVRGPGVCSAYINMPDETAVAFVDGWYRTSDIVRRDVDGVFWFEGRTTEMLKVGGIRVFPLEIERALHEHPDVAEAVVVRAEERVRGEIPRAIVRPRLGANLTAQDVKNHCRRQLAVYKVPRIVELWDDIPRLPNGKVDRVAIQAS